MKVVGFSGSPRKDGNTDVMVNAVLTGAEEAGAETVFYNLAQLNLKGCQGCMFCRSNDTCAVKDDMINLYKEIESSDAVVIGSPIYMYQMTAQTKEFMDRLFPFLNSDYTSKVRKPTLLLFSQGNGNTDAFKSYYEHISGAYNLLGFPVKEVIVEGQASVKGEVSGRTELISRLKKTGADLFN